MSLHNHDHGVEQKLSFAVVINVLLTVVQVVGGVMSGSLSLVADALHNLSDAGAIVIAVVARRIGNKDANETMTYGYKRAEILAVVINSMSLIAIGLYLIYEAFQKYFNPAPIDGWIVFWIAGVALVIDIATAMLTYSAGAKDSINIRAAFIHNVSDALASVAVIIAGIMIILYQLYIVDVIVTILISIYVIYHGVVLLKKCVSILMQAVPEGIHVNELKLALENIDGVEEVEHIHVWQLDDKKIFFDGHFSLAREGRVFTKQKIRLMLEQQFKITHCTIEER